MKVSILITTYQRPDHLRWCLESLCRQDLSSWEVEIVVLNDATDGDGTREVVERYAEKGARYLFTGQRNANGPIWRVPGFAYNVGIRQTTGDIVVLTSSDIYHLDSTIVPIVVPLLNYWWLLGTVKHVYRDDGSLIEYLRQEGEGPDVADVIDRVCRKRPKFAEKYTAYHVPHPDVPFLLAVRRDHLEYIRGYDEDFIGYGCEDTDLIERLCSIGCEHVYTDAECVHMFHGECHLLADLSNNPRWQYNHSLLRRRRGRPQRNCKREWGQLEENTSCES